MIKLSLSHVSFSYIDVPVFHDIDLAIESGEMVVLLAPNGSGKTTLIKLLSGVLRPTEGEIHLDGSSLRQLKRREVAQRVAVVPQQFHMPFAFTLREVVLLGRTPSLNEDTTHRYYSKEDLDWTKGSPPNIMGADRK